MVLVLNFSLVVPLVFVVWEPGLYLIFHPVEEILELQLWVALAEAEEVLAYKALRDQVFSKNIFLSFVMCKHVKKLPCQLPEIFFKIPIR